MNWQDPIVADVWRTREALSAKFGFDLHAIFADLRARQRSVGDRLVPPKLKEDSERPEAVERPAQPVPDR